MKMHRVRQPLIPTMWRRSVFAVASKSGANDDTGLTLLECLAAIVVVGMIGTAIAPVLVLSVATRIQSQKSEQALNLAQGEIDRIRVLVEQGEGPDYTAAIDSLPEDTAAADITAVAAPTAGAGPITPANIADFDAPNKTLAVDIDDDGEFDFAVQRFRTEKDGDNSANDEGFFVGVRVYDYNALTSGNTLSSEQGSLALTSSQGDRLEAPLATLYTSVFRTAEGAALCNYMDFTPNTSGSSKDKPLGCN